MMRFWLILAILGCLFTTSASAERRVALVMGNSNYKNAIQLPNPAGDAQAMADLLKSLGFEVVFGANLGREAMAEKLSEFARTGGGADVALFFYAGHGMQLSGKNLLIPVDANLKSELDAKMQAIEIDAILQDTMADAKVKLVLLDACRDNPFAQQIQSSAPKTRSVVVGAGLAEMRPGEGTLIAFATGPGQVAIDGEAKHSPFTRALLNHLAEPGVEIRHALTRVRAQVADETHKQQLPWENTNLTGFYYLAKADIDSSQQPTSQAAAPVKDAGAEMHSMMELELWKSVQTSKSAEEYKAYIEKYPNGTFSDVARSRIAALSRPDGVAAAANTANDEIKTAEPSAASEDALGLNNDAWREIQRRLAGLGFGTRSIDGQAGEGTRRAIRSWQSARAYPSSGYLNRLQRDALLKEVAPATAPAEAARSAGNDSGSRGSRRGRSQGGGDADAAHMGALIGGVMRGMGRGGGFPF